MVLIMQQIITVLAALTFVMFLFSAVCVMYANTFPQSERREKVVAWNTTFSFGKNMFWQFTIYSLAILGLLTFLL